MAVELKYNQLKKRCDKRFLNFESTDDIEAYDGAVGQEKAVDALKFGMSVKAKGYNAYVSGLPGTGKTTFARRVAETLAKDMPVPDDLCYVYNFKEPKCPKAIRLPAGMGRSFRDDMAELVCGVSEEIPEIFSGREFELHKLEIVKNYQDKRDELLKNITNEAREQNFGVKTTSSGIYFMPIINGEMITEEQYDNLPDDEREAISKTSEAIQEKAQEALYSIREFERLTHKEVGELEYNIGLKSLARHVMTVQERYADRAEVLSYLAAVKEDLLENMGELLDSQLDADDIPAALVPWLGKRNKDDTLSKYKVNLVTDNSGLSGAPVVVDFNPTYANLVGEVEYDSEFGNLTSDFMKIKQGLLHKANGGFLILQAREVLTNFHVWEALRRGLITGEAVIEPLREYATGLSVSCVRPEPVEISVKVVLAGPEFYYDILQEYDESFGRLFRIKTVFDYEMDYNAANVQRIAGFVKKFADECKPARFDRDAVCALVEYASRLAERQDKLTTELRKLHDIMSEAWAWASSDGKAAVTGEYIGKAISQKEKRAGLYEQKLSELIMQNVIMIDTTGEKTGQINGLAVIDSGDYVFAKPTRITATTYVGKAGIVNIEKEAEMSGAIHNKGVQVIIGFLGQKYAQNMPLSLSCRVCFEQNYNGIDGDSASSSELYAILSSLANAPIKQGIAVTGSINQRGEIQAIGGVTHKIEGFFDVCRQRGLTGGQGVIIPSQNVSDLTLSDEVAEAVKKGKFHIFAISHIDEGIEILTGIPAGEMINGKYPLDTIHGRAYRKLRMFYRRSLNA